MSCKLKPPELKKNTDTPKKMKDNNKDNKIYIKTFHVLE